MQGSKPSTIRNNNQNMIIQLIAQNGKLSRAQIAELMQSTKPTISKNVEALIERGYLVETGKADNQMGKKATLLDLNLDYGYILAIDLSKESVKFVIANLREQWVFFEEYKDMNIEEATKGVNYLIDFINKCQIDHKKILKVVVAYPGVVGHQGSYYLTNMKIKEKLLKSILPYLEEYFLDNLVIKNDINLAIIAEKELGVWGEHQNLYYISGDVGFGSAMILENRLFEGDRMAAGEIGFILPKTNQKGAYITLEERVSIVALIQRYNEVMGHDKTLDFLDLIKNINEKEEKAMQLYQNCIDELCIAITSVTSILDIEHVIVAGRLFHLKEDMLDELQQRIDTLAPFQVQLHLSQMAYPSLKGALRIGIQEVLNTIIE